MTLEELYHQSLEALPPILRGLGREKRLSPEDLEDLRSDIQVKLLEDDYRVLRRWDNRSSLKGYLGTVVYNIWHDRVRREKGKVRVSTAARQLGPPAPELEVLLGRQGLTFDQAYQAIKPRFPGLSRGEAEEIAAQLNPKPGRIFESEDVVTRQPDLEPAGDKLLEQREKLVKKRKAFALMHGLLSELPEEDRILLVRAHGEGVKFSCIARSLGIDQRSLYRRNERLITKLRTNLEEAGIRWEDLSEVLGIDEPPETAPRAWGKFRPSPAARRLGPPAPELEVLLVLQGLTFDEAYQVIKPRFPGLSRGEAEEIAAQISPRPHRRFRVEGEGELILPDEPGRLVPSAIPGHTGFWRMKAVTETCVTPTDLAVFLEGSLTGEERDRMVRHLNHCPDCFERYIGAARLLDAIEEEEASAG
ncbi:MAG TPA: sigma-70 family RNA polymerase sigma factor [Thermoanaerobaculia bacterium]|nr:sigma-70 family RNA polymerase sigma factor [Thermoanaerobaculia bacterium]